MAAIVTINEHNTSTPGTRTDKTSAVIRCRTNDSAVVDANNPIVKPISGNARSYEKWIRLRIEGVGPAFTINNIQFYTTGGPGGNAVVYARTTNPGTYATPAIPANDSAGTDVTGYPTSNRKSMSVANAGPYAATNADMGDFLVVWMTIDSGITAPQTPTSSLNMYFSYDEV